MDEITVNDDEEADVLYVSFGWSDHVTGVKLADNISDFLAVGLSLSPQIPPLPQRAAA